MYQTVSSNTLHQAAVVHNITLIMIAQLLRNSMLDQGSGQMFQDLIKNISGNIKFYRVVCRT